eukprot:2877935-Amphidinium_carterae.1
MGLEESTTDSVPRHSLCFKEYTWLSNSQAANFASRLCSHNLGAALQLLVDALDPLVPLFTFR